MPNNSQRPAGSFGLDRFIVILLLLAVAGWMVYEHVRPFHVVAGGRPIVAGRSLTPLQSAVIADLDRQAAANIEYRDGYFSGGEPPANIGVCTDVVIRSYRAAGVDFHALVARDIRRRTRAYDITKPDANIDYRRCRNLAVFFKRYGKMLPVAGKKCDWQPADIVLFDTRQDGVPDHIGVITDPLDSAGEPTVVHHWPGMTVCRSDFIGRLPVLYHFRWIPAKGRKVVSS